MSAHGPAWDFGKPIRSADGRLLVCVLCDFTLYADHLSAQDLEVALRVYGTVSPRDSWQMYKIRETVVWDRVARPSLLPQNVRNLGSQAVVESVNRRIRDDQIVELRVWDGHSPQAWSFTCWRDYGDQRERVFYRFMMPLATEAATLQLVARLLCDQIQGLSGHGGYSFGYVGTRKAAAFSEIYKLARRYWCVDVEDLDRTLDATRRRLKSIGWLTFASHDIIKQYGLAPSLSALSGDVRIGIEEVRHGALFTAGPAPIPGDIHRDRQSMEPYFKIAQVLGPAMVSEPPAFVSWHDSETTTRAWFRRFLADPAAL